MAWSRAHGLPLFLVNSASAKQMASDGTMQLTKWATHYQEWSEEETGDWVSGVYF